MAEVVKIRVKCHACLNIIEGSAKYGTGHYVSEGVDFELIAIGRVEKNSKTSVMIQVQCICPRCGVKCRWDL